MADSPSDGKRATNKPLPQCKAFLICDRVGVDKVTRQFNLHRIVNSLSFRKFPAESPPLAAYVQLYDGIGHYDLGMELRNLADESSVAAELFSHLDFPERLVKMELVLPIDSLRLPYPGRYEIAILIGGREVATQFIDAENSLTRRLTMVLEPNSGSNSADPPEELRDVPPYVDGERREHIITAQDAGWITPTAFVLPLTFVPVDPPRPIKKTPPVG